MSNNSGSIAPKERINIYYKSNTGGASEQIELPLKLLVIDDFTCEDRQPININKANFDEVVNGHDLSINTSVPNRLQEDSEDEVGVNLKFKSIADFAPAQVAEQIPELASMLELRRALQALKGPLGNVPAFRKAIQSILENDETRAQVINELGLDEE